MVTCLARCGPIENMQEVPDPHAGLQRVTG